MNTVLTIGTHRFVLASAAVAQAICETLAAAPQVNRSWDRGSEIPTFAPERADLCACTFATERATPEQLRIVAKPVAASPLATAVLGEPIRTGRKTRRTLANRAKEIVR